MLALMRRKNESIFIYPGSIPEGMTVAELFAGGPIEIKISDTNDEQCKLGINAPKELNIVRDDAKVVTK
jgi:sRNA-binding carbon storage regulator CsrA